MLESLISTAAENDEINIIKKSILDSLDLIIKMIALPKKLNSPWTSRAFDEEKSMSGNLTLLQRISGTIQRKSISRILRKEV